MAPYARISRVHGSWRVRVPGHPPKFFADSSYGDGSHPKYSQSLALDAAIKWRDQHWDGKDLSRKLTRRDRYDIRRSKLHYIEIAEKYGITPNYVHQIRRSND